MWKNDEPITDEERATIDLSQKYSHVDRETWLSTEWTGNGYRQHRDWIRSGKNFSGFDGIHAQDLAVQYSMGPIVDRTQEHLAGEDFLVINVRRHLLELMRDGHEPGAVDYERIQHGWLEIASETNLKEVLSSPALVSGA